MKKSFVLLLSSIILLTSLLPLTASAASFSDLSENHWAYSSIYELVSNGTINGYNDGTFKPDNMVTRAEFVKMIGQGSTMRSTPYSDVLPGHWGYDYIMSSGVEADDMGRFNPSVAITRDDVIEILWSRNGKKTDAWAPAVITDQSKNKNAISWAYSYGLMHGDDGVHLRLSDGIKRSEAATLIIRARNIDETVSKKTFTETVNGDILKNVYNSLELLEGEYTPSKTITNGEMARAALKIGCQEYTPTYRNMLVSKPFEHKYAKDLYIMGYYAVGSEKITESYADAPANFADTASFLCYTFIKQSSKSFALSKTTEALNGKVNNYSNTFLTFAKNHGIWNYEEKDLDAPITQKDFMALVVLYDHVIGMQKDITTDIHSISGRNISENHSLELCAVDVNPNFKFTLKDMPASIYTTPFEALGEKTQLPKDTYNFTREYNIIFTGILLKYKDAVKAYSDTDLRFTFYPSLCYDNGYGHTMRVKVEVMSLSGTKSLAEIFPACSEQVALHSASQGSVFYVDLETGEPVSSMDMPVDAVYIGQYIK